jgi:hypothetical protein
MTQNLNSEQNKDELLRLVDTLTDEEKEELTAFLCARLET